MMNGILAGKHLSIQMEKLITVNEWKILNRALNEVLGEVNNLKALNMLINPDPSLELDSFSK